MTATSEQLHRAPDVAVLVPAAGLGLRLGGGSPKALRELAGESLLTHCCRALTGVGLIVVAAPPDAVDAVRRVVPHALVVPGGATRQESVAAALAAVPPDFDIILVHDAARALAPFSLVEKVAQAVRDGYEAVIPVLPVVDTIKQVDAQGDVVATVDRAQLRAVQTPQGFRRALLVKAHAAAVDSHTDDAGMVERLGATVHTVPGDPLALKITTPNDLRLAEALLKGAL
jgi:2-C-methyl-D-erythritol 4-phosphate cytidylyltransferase